MDPSDQMALVVYPGNVSIADLSAIRPIELIAGDSASEHNEEYAANMQVALVFYSASLFMQKGQRRASNLLD